MKIILFIVPFPFLLSIENHLVVHTQSMYCMTCCAKKQKLLHTPPSLEPLMHRFYHLKWLFLHYLQSSIIFHEQKHLNLNQLIALIKILNTLSFHWNYNPNCDFSSFGLQSCKHSKVQHGLMYICKIVSMATYFDFNLMHFKINLATYWQWFWNCLFDCNWAPQMHFHLHLLHLLLPTQSLQLFCACLIVVGAPKTI